MFCSQHLKTRLEPRIKKFTPHIEFAGPRAVRQVGETTRAAACSKSQPSNRSADAVQQEQNGCVCELEARYAAGRKANPSCCPLRPRTAPFPEKKSILGVIYGVLLWADINAATPLGAWGALCNVPWVVLAACICVRFDFYLETCARSHTAGIFLTESRACIVSEDAPYSASQHCLNIAPHCSTGLLKKHTFLQSSSPHLVYSSASFYSNM